MNASMQIDPEITILVLARSLVDVYEQLSSSGSPVHQDATLPASVRRAMAMLSGLSLAGGTDDIGTSIHVIMELACDPMADWGPVAFHPPFRYSDVVLIDRDLGMPTEDCRELSRQGGSEAVAQEEIHHEALRAAVATYPSAQRDRAYTAIREFVVRNMAVPEERLHRFILEGGHAAAARTIMSFYRPLPLAALHGGVATRCGRCGGLLWPDRDRAAWPDGRCRVRQCRVAHPAAVVGDRINEPTAWRLATPAAIAFWGGPGLDEIRIFDALRAAGRDAALYPFGDAADIGVDGLSIGIDAKTYVSPVLLASKLSASIGRLSMFDRKIIAVPDDKLRSNPSYLRQLATAYVGNAPLEFRTASDTIREMTR